MCSNHIIPKFIYMFSHLSNVLPIFFSIILTCSVLVILIPNPIHSVLFLVLVFCNTTALLLLFGIEFLSIMLIIIYVGAIAILFLFVVMMLDIKVNLKNKNDFYNYIFFCIFIIFSFFLGTYISTVNILNNNSIGDSDLFYTQWVSLVDQITNTATIGQILYTFYLAYFLIAGIILLIALVGAVTLTHKNVNNVNIDTTTFKQISRLKENAIFNLDHKKYKYD